MQGVRRHTRYPYAVTGLAAAVLLTGAYLGILQWSGNFHEAIPSELYRSAQLHPGDLARYQQQYGIRTVINLRGDNAGTPWYDHEREEAELLGVRFINFRMKASRELGDGEALALISAMRDAPKPLLIHCRAGADRTGLASALYFAAVADKGEAAAEQQLWLNYGHLPIPFLSTYAMNRTFERLEPMLGFKDS
ncbi:MAG: protein tyrosine phosphatase [Azospirillum brasilense]|nr:MAG: protein tyrosine phosphatase [Azospirillum brasilense]